MIKGKGSEKLNLQEKYRRRPAAEVNYEYNGPVFIVCGS